MPALQPASVSIPAGLSLNDDISSSGRTSAPSTGGMGGTKGVNGVRPTASEEKVLVVGSLATAQDRSYISVVEGLEAQKGKAVVDRQLWDRIVAGAASLKQGSYTAAHVLLTPQDLGTFNLADLFRPIGAALKEGARVECVVGAGQGVAEALRGAGFTEVSSAGGKVTARAPPPVSNGDAASVPLSLRKGSSKAAKASLWAFSSAPPPPGDDSSLIDEDSLLTAEDLARPARITRPDCDVKKTRKACRNCTCGLRELELEEEDDLPNGVGGNGAKRQEAVEEAVRGKEALDEVRGDGGVKKKKVKTGAVTSSCGNCYLGDAFRCSSCPYLGLPAFEPGQKVELTAEMGDDI